MIKHYCDKCKKEQNFNNKKYHIDIEFDNEDKVKFECADCGCYFWVENRNNFKCPNCEFHNQQLKGGNEKNGQHKI